MKVEIITLHRITNFGSMLQSYATQTIIENLGYQAEILDFVPEGISFKRGCFPKNHTPLWMKLIKFFPLFVCNTFQFIILNRFIKKYIRVTPIRYRSYQEILDNVPQANIYLSGSDQVWNTQNNNPKNDLKAYYLGFVPEGKKKVAYAGSFGKNTFTEEESFIIKKYLSHYDHISVREDVGLITLKKHGIDKGVHVVDPTLLLSAEAWKKFAAKKAPKPGYIFVYNLNRNRMIKKIAIRIARQRKLRIINFADSFDFITQAKNRLFNTPLDFINHIAHADLIITDSFHGVAFSINLNRQFICTKAPKYNSRIESLLRQCKLAGTRLVDTVEEGVKQSYLPIDYHMVNPLLEQARQQSLEYLKNALS